MKLVKLNSKSSHHKEKLFSISSILYVYKLMDTVELAGPLGTLLGLSQWKRASSRGEAGTSDFLSVSDSDIRVPAELGRRDRLRLF